MEGSCPICEEFSTAKSPAGIIDLALPIDQTPALTAELLEHLSREKAVAFFCGVPAQFPVMDGKLLLGGWIPGELELFISS